MSSGLISFGTFRPQGAQALIQRQPSAHLPKTEPAGDVFFGRRGHVIAASLLTSGVVAVVGTGGAASSRGDDDGTPGYEIAMPVYSADAPGDAPVLSQMAPYDGSGGYNLVVEQAPDTDNGGTTSTLRPEANKPGNGKWEKNFSIEGEWDASDAFKSAVVDAAIKLDTDPDWLFAMMQYESGLKADAQNDSGATGIFQKMPDRGADGNYIEPWQIYGMPRQDYINLGEVGQVPYLIKYLSPYKGKLNLPHLVYAAIAGPAVFSNNENPGLKTIMYPAGSSEALSNPSWQDKNGNVTVGKLGKIMEVMLNNAGLHA